MDLKNTCQEIVNTVFDLSKVPGETRLKVREQATEAAMECFTRMQLASRLTEQHLKILELLSEGYSSKEIGRKLFLSHRTIDVHRYNLIKLFECRNMAQLIKKATDYKII
jgi:DNA-binding NarL/FixJ family response regulator